LHLVQPRGQGGGEGSVQQVHRGSGGIEDPGEDPAVVLVLPNDVAAGLADDVALFHVHPPVSDAFDQGGDTHAAADAQGDDRAVQAGAFEFVDHGPQDHRPRGAQRVAHGDRAAVDVEPLVVDAEVALEFQGDGGERLVDLPQVDVRRRQTGGVQELAGGGGGACEHDGRVRAGNGGGGDPGTRGQGGPVDDARGVPTGVHVVDLLHPVVLLQGDGVEPAVLPHGSEGGAQPGEGLHGGAAADVLVVVQDDQAVLVADRDDGPGEVAFVPRVGGTLLGPGGEGVHVPAGEALRGGDEVGTDALRDVGGVEAGGGVKGPGAAVGADGHAGHRFHAAGDDQLLPTGADLRRGQVGGLQAGSAEAVELEPADGIGQAGGDGRDAGDVGALVPDRGDDPEDQVVDPGGVEAGVAFAQGVDEADDQRDRLGPVQCALPAAAAGRAHGVVDVGLAVHAGWAPFTGGAGAVAPTAILGETPRWGDAPGPWWRGAGRVGTDQRRPRSRNQ